MKNTDLLFKKNRVLIFSKERNKLLKFQNNHFKMKLLGKNVDKGEG